jgi:hypothetical protein
VKVQQKSTSSINYSFSKKTSLAHKIPLIVNKSDRTSYIKKAISFTNEEPAI